MVELCNRVVVYGIVTTPEAGEKVSTRGGSAFG